MSCGSSRISNLNDMPMHRACGVSLICMQEHPAFVPPQDRFFRVPTCMSRLKNANPVEFVKGDINEGLITDV